MKDNSNISEELLEIIERYIDGSMNTQESKDFIQLLEVDDDFKIKFEETKTMFLGIEAQALKEQLNEFHEDIPKIETPSKVRFLTVRKFAAAAAIIIAIGSIWFFSSSPNERLYAKYFKPDPGLPTTMSSTDEFEFYDAMVNYKYGDYEIAISKWKTLLALKPQNDTLNYFLGVANLANKNEKYAIHYLKKSTSNTEFTFINDAYFYLGLAYLKEGNIELAKKNFDLSSSDKGKEILLKLSD